eukprot:scaffold3797_cov267-Chaetoceros_neogracile.AAC.5
MKSHEPHDLKQICFQFRSMRDTRDACGIDMDACGSDTCTEAAKCGVSRHCLAAISVVQLNDNEYPLDASL